MKRKPQEPSKRPISRGQFGKLPNQVVKHQVNPFLSLEDRTRLAGVNRLTYQNSSSDSETMQCAKSTLKGLACTNAARGLLIGDECVGFCKDHINFVVRNFIDLAARNDVVPGVKPWVRVKLPDSDAKFPDSDSDITILHVTWNPRLQSWAGSVVDFDFSHPEAFNQEFSNEIPFTCQNETLGECVTHHFDFRSASWRELEINWKLADNTEMDAQEVQIGQNTVVLDNQAEPYSGFFALRILNTHFVHPQLLADEARGYSCESKTKQGLDCFDFLRSHELDESCTVWCDKNRATNIYNVLNLLTTNTLFGETHQHQTVALNEQWKINVVNYVGDLEMQVSPEDTEHHALSAGHLVSSNMENLNSGIRVIFPKREPSESRLLRLWIQAGENTVPIYRFSESNEYVVITVQTAQPESMGWAEDADLDNPE
jgi:hypothetical protein